MMMMNRPSLPTLVDQVLLSRSVYVEKYAYTRIVGLRVLCFRLRDTHRAFCYPSRNVFAARRYT